MTTALLAGLGVVVLLAFGLRRAPVATALAVCALGAANHLGVVMMPPGIAGPIASVKADVASWQARQAAKLVCAEAASRQPPGDPSSVAACP